MWSTGLNREDRVRIGVWLSPSCLEGLRWHISGKYPKYTRGLLSFEVENLINEGIANFKKVISEKGEAKLTHTKSRNYVFSEKIELLRDIIISELDGVMQEKEERILDIIKLAEGLRDNRPAKDRLRLLIAKGYCTENRSVGKVKLIKFAETRKEKIEEKKEEEFDRALQGYEIAPLQGDLR